MADADQIRSRRIQYETEGLDLADIDADPVTQWHRWYDQAVEAGLVEPEAMTVATVDAEGRPDARIVLVRGVDESGLVFFTNYTSAKGTQLETTAVASAVFGWLGLHRQVRVRGHVERLDAESSSEYFASRPRGSRIGAWASPQSSVIADRDELDRRVAEVEARFPGDDVPRPDFWGGWLIRPFEWEFWQGRPSRLHDRLRFSGRPGDWTIERLAP
ncbi:MAG: pyridoxamine 5'-phosphate oxidase [Acidimicrobiia bacterium]|nr:pyridoxamine 5'-phosphate oxidase [Acidimicrobiia bacterium]